MDDATGSSKINSSQNGFLLRIAVHRMFDQYLISINPDDSCKVVVFDTDPCGYDGRILDPVCRNPNDPPPCVERTSQVAFPPISPCEHERSRGTDL